MKSFKQFMQYEKACWKGYRQLGMKKKGDRMVPNCVPEEVELDEEFNKQMMLRFTSYLKEFAIWEPNKSQTKGIARGDMPQVKSSDYDELLTFLKSKDIRMKSEKVKAETLKATQRNFNKDKIVGAAQNYEKLLKAKPIIVSSDNYIIDGHHRWLGAVNVGGDINIYRSNVKVNDLLQAVKDFSKSFTKTIDESFAYRCITEGYSVQYVRDKDVDVLKLKDTKSPKWVEVRGKKNYEVTYDRNDAMHKAIDSLGKAANISDLMNGEVVVINPNHPRAKKAIENIQRLMK